MGSVLRGRHHSRSPATSKAEHAPKRLPSRMLYESLSPDEGNGPRRCGGRKPRAQRQRACSKLRPLMAPRPPTTARVLSASPGPRQTPWKRSFNPFRGEAGLPLARRGGCLRASPRLQPSHRKLRAVAGDGIRLERRQASSFASLFGRASSGRTASRSPRATSGSPSISCSECPRWTAKASGRSCPRCRPSTRNTVEFTLKRPFTPGLASIGQQAIVAEHKWKDVAQPAAFDDPAPVGTGPFTEVKRFEPTVYELGRNPKYWQAGKPGVDVLRVPLYRSNEEILQALQAGELDWASLFLPDVEKAWVAADAARHQYWYPDLGPAVLLYLNTQQKPLDDTQRAQGVQHGPGPGPDRQRGDERLRGPRGRDRSCRLGEELEGRGLLDPHPPAGRSATWRKRTSSWTRPASPAGSDQIRVGPSGPMRYELNVVQGWTDWVAACDILRQNLAEVGIAVSVKAHRLQRVGRRPAARTIHVEHGLRKPGTEPVSVLPRPDGWIAGAAHRRKGPGQLRPLRQRRDDAARAAVRSHFRRDGAAGREPRDAAPLRRERAEPAPLHEPPLGRVQHDPPQRVPQPLPPVCERGARGRPTLRGERAPSPPSSRYGPARSGPQGAQSRRLPSASTGRPSAAFLPFVPIGLWMRPGFSAMAASSSASERLSEASPKRS